MTSGPGTLVSKSVDQLCELTTSRCYSSLSCTKKKICAITVRTYALQETKLKTNLIKLKIE